MTRKPPPHRRKANPLNRAQLAPRVIQPGPSPMKADMESGVPTLADVAAYLSEQRPVVGRTREVDGRSEMFDGSLWLCAEPLLNVPDGMCASPSPCPIHPGEEP